MSKTINLVAIGDSLTVGFIPTTFSSQSYTQFLKAMADALLKRSGKNNALEVRVTNKGINGDLTSDMLLRFRRDVVNLKPNYVIILGGTNDIGWGLVVDRIFVNLKRMFTMAMDNAIVPIGCTVPSVLGWDEGIPPRVQLNHVLRRFCSEAGIPCVKIFEATCDPDTNRLRSNYSSDGLHLTASGYRKVAETIFHEAICDLLIREPS